MTPLLQENPCTSAKDYRKFVIYMLPRLCKLDGVEISTEEREQAEAYFAERPSVPGLNLNGGAVKYSLKPPTNPTNRMPSPRSVVRDASQQVSPLPNKGFDSPRIIISESPRGPTTGGRCACVRLRKGFFESSVSSRCAGVVF